MAPATGNRSSRIALLCALVFGTSAFAEDTLTIVTNTPEVTITERAAGRFAVLLPTLEFALQVNAHCAGDRKAEAVSISVADTRTALTAADIGEQEATQLTLRIPAAQIPPLTIEEFCIANEDGAERPRADDRLGIAGAISLQASLLCADDAQNRRTYTSQGLDVVLQCDRTAADDDAALAQPSE